VNIFLALLAHGGKPPPTGNLNTDLGFYFCLEFAGGSLPRAVF